LTKKLYIGLFVLIILVIAYLAGPQPDTPKYSDEFPRLTSELHDLENYITKREKSANPRQGCSARIVWADSLRKTSYAFLYLHGFSACEKEGDPVHYNVAQHFGANLYLARLAGHGRQPEKALLDFTPTAAWETAKEELAIANNLGEKVVVVSTSTGSTLALKLAAEFPDKVHALINLSPNYRIKNPLAPLLNNPWGWQVTYLTYGSKRHIEYEEDESKLYWDTTYTIDALVQLQELIETTITPETFSKVSCPVLSLYYYKNEEEQDQVIDVSYIPEVHKQLATPKDKKTHVALPNPGNHVIGSYIKSEDYQSVQDEIIRFSENILGLKPVGDNSAATDVARQLQ